MSTPTTPKPGLERRAFVGLAQTAIAMALCLFLPAWTWRYWQAWLFLAVFFGAALATTRYLLRHDPQLLERRVSAGPVAETDPAQKVIQAIASLYFLGILVIPALDHRFGWSHLPPWAAVVGDALVALGFWIVFRVFRENTYTAGVVRVEAGQTVIDTGPYAIVRHPMYAGALLLFLGIPLALGSAWGLGLFVPGLLVLAWRLTNEERLLCEELPGYRAYREKTRYRLIPRIW
ncbi:MAG TPA: isoprenylcysteine carboxylmethyltransferase family protein [Oscillatoriaceae cyanobacterium]